MSKELGCNLEVSKFELQLCYYIHFQTNTPEEIIGLLYLSSPTPPGMA